MDPMKTVVNNCTLWTGNCGKQGHGPYENWDCGRQGHGPYEKLGTVVNNPMDMVNNPMKTGNCGKQGHGTL